MTGAAQNLDVLRVGSQGRCCAMRLDVMALKVFCRAAFLTLAALRNNLCNSFSACISSLAASVIPFGMICSPKIPAPSNCQAWARTVFSGSSTAFADLEKLAAFFAGAVNHDARPSWLKFVRALSRASVCLSPDMSVRSSKLFSASPATQSYVASSINLSLESSHG